MCKWTDEQLKEFDGARDKMLVTLEKYLKELDDESESEFYISNRHLRHVVMNSICDEVCILSGVCMEELTLGFIKRHSRKVEEITLALACVCSLQKKASAYDYCSECTEALV